MDAFKDAILAYAVYYPVVDFFSAIAIACVIWFGGQDVMRGIVSKSVSIQFDPQHLISFHLVATAASLGVLIAFIAIRQRFFRPIMDFSEKYNILQSAMAASERIFKMLDTPVEVVSPAVTKKPQGPGRIEFDHVWFAYREMAEQQRCRKRSNGHGGTEPLSATDRGAQPDWVLRDVTFAIEPGETVAVVGHTGAGKTTLISLLHALLRRAKRRDPHRRRRCQRDGSGRSAPRASAWCCRIRSCSRGTIGGKSGWAPSAFRMRTSQQAAEDVNLADFIRELPKGFDEEVRERGSTLSTGQKQLISFARALAHDPKILILDEATSSVDTETEFRVRDALARMVEGRTSLIIAHRLSTIQRADKIIVMHKGQVREMGTHQELLANRGIYYKLYQLQYKDQEIRGRRLRSSTGSTVESADD